MYRWGHFFHAENNIWARPLRTGRVLAVLLRDRNISKKEKLFFVDPRTFKGIDVKEYESRGSV